jgi:hypothetical protein
VLFRHVVSVGADRGRLEPSFFGARTFVRAEVGPRRGNRSRLEARSMEPQRAETDSVHAGKAGAGAPRRYEEVLAGALRAARGPLGEAEHAPRRASLDELDLARQPRRTGESRAGADKRDPEQRDEIGQGELSPASIRASGPELATDH